MNKAQSATEYIILTGVALILVTAIFYYFHTSSTIFSNSVRVSWAQNAVNSIRDKANSVCLMGSPAKIIFDIYIPSGVARAGLKNQTAYINLTMDNYFTDVFANSVCNLTGSIPTTEGTKRMKVEALGVNVDVSQVT